MPIYCLVKIKNVMQFVCRDLRDRMEIQLKNEQLKTQEFRKQKMESLGPIGRKYCP